MHLRTKEFFSAKTLLLLFAFIAMGCCGSKHAADEGNPLLSSKALPVKPAYMSQEQVEKHDEWKRQRIKQEEEEERLREARKQQKKQQKEARIQGDVHEQTLSQPEVSTDESVRNDEPEIARYQDSTSLELNVEDSLHNNDVQPSSFETQLSEHIHESQSAETLPETAEYPPEISDTVGRTDAAPPQLLTETLPKQKRSLHRHKSVDLTSVFGVENT